MELWISQQPLPCFMGAAHLCDSSNRTGEDQVPFSLSTIKGSEEMLFPLPVSPGCYVACTAVWQVGWGYRIFYFPLEKDTFLSRKKPLLSLVRTWWLCYQKNKGWRESQCKFFSMKRQIPIMEIQILQSCCFSRHGHHVYFSPLTSPCHIPLIHTLKQQCQSQSSLFHV